MRDGSMVVMFGIALVIGVAALLHQLDIDLRGAVVAAAEWVTGKDAQY